MMIIIHNAHNSYDAAVQRMQGLKKQKNAKADKVKQSEDEVQAARSTLESTGREALATMIDTNNFAEGETIAKLCLYAPSITSHLFQLH